MICFVSVTHAAANRTFPRVQHPPGFPSLTPCWMPFPFFSFFSVIYNLSFGLSRPRVSRDSPGGKLKSLQAFLTPHPQTRVQCQFLTHCFTSDTKTPGRKLVNMWIVGSVEASASYFFAHMNTVPFLCLNVLMCHMAHPRLATFSSQLCLFQGENIRFLRNGMNATLIYLSFLNQWKDIHFVSLLQPSWELFFFVFTW